MKIKKQPSYLGKNLKFLRERRNLTQVEVATSLKITRAKINAFENEVNNNPTVEDLHKFTGHYKISADSLLWVNLKKLAEPQLANLEAGNDEYTMGTKIRVLATTIDSKNRENIEIVPIKAKAGYATGFGNSKFIESLESFHLPVLSEKRKFRMFQIEGDSMFPIPDKSFVIAAFVENWKELKTGQACVVVTKDDGIIFKEITNHLDKNRTLLMHSLNPLYKDYSVEASSINEIWKFVNYISNQIPVGGITLENIGGMISELKSEILNQKSKPI